MSTPHPLFTVTLSGDQLATLRAFLDYAGGAPEMAGLAEQIPDALNLGAGEGDSKERVRS